MRAVFKDIIKPFFATICKPLESMPRIYTAKQAILLYDLIEKLESDKPKVIREKKKPVEKIIEEETTIQEPVTRSSRSNKGKAAIRYDDEYT